MAEQRITLTIDDQGGITAKTQGFKGEACFEALDSLLDLEGDVVTFRKTDEFHQQVKVQNKTSLTQKGY